MRKNFLEELYKSIIPENEGYDFLFCDEIYIPVYKQELKITIREIVKLNLLEEKVLQLIDIGVFQIDEISKILGLNRRLLDATIADLHVKNMITVSSEKCTLLSLGNKALKELQSAKKTQESLRNVHVDAIKGKILADVSGFQLVDKGINNDNKLKTNVQQDDLAVVREQISTLNEIFSAEYVSNMNFSGDTQTVKEMLTVDSVENTYVTFIRSAIAVFVSTNGYDIDIQPLSQKDKSAIEIYKDEIIKQIREKKVLREHFKQKTLNKYQLKELNTLDSIKEKLKTFHYSKNKAGEIVQSLRDTVLSDRKLLPGEEEIIIRELSSDANDLTLIVHNIDDWAFNNQFVGRLSEYVGNAKLHIVYANSRSAKKALERIKSGITIADTKKENRGQFICWEFDGKAQVYGIPRLVNVINKYTQCVAIEYYLQFLPKSREANSQHERE